MRLFAIFVALLFLPLVTAISDLSIYSEGHYESQSDAPILVEWFHGTGDEEQLEELVKMDRDGEITLLHWRTGADEENGGLPEDDAEARMMYHGFNQTPSVAIDGYPENISDIGPEVRTNEVEIEWNIELIGSTEVELLNITATWTNPKALNGATQMHVFIIESEAIDSKGRVVHNLVRDWAPSSTFFFTNNTTNAWNETITRDHLDGAGIDFGDASHANDYEMLLVMIGGFENETSNRVLSIQRAKVPTSWQSVDKGASLTPLLMLIGLMFCIGFVVMAERKREIGLPRLEGSWTSEKGVLEYRIITGYSIDIGELMMGEGWKANGRIKKETVAPNQTHSGTLRVSGEGEFSLQLCVKVEQLGDWILDLNLPEPRTND
ncbi:MAG: hypothetical protein HN544_00770 [Euryarchaeota archaeon]|jgi:hypothetical protein|nr:hypothetical protein [Euryarchaeota archaeon]